MRSRAVLWVSMFCCAVTGASTLLAAEATSATGAERTAQFLRQRQPVVLDRETLEAGMRPLPDNMPIRRVTVRPGQKAEIGGVAGATGTLVYKNTLGANFFAPGANVQVADDLLLIAAGGCDMSFLEVLVTGGGNGSGPGFHVDFSLFTGCPGQGGTLIPGTEGEADLTDNGGWLVSIDLEGTEVTIPADPWLALKVSTTAAGWVLGRPAEVGFTANLFHAPAFPCNAWFGGVPYAGFYAEMYCGGDVETQFEAYRSDAFSGFFDEVALTEQWADDIVPISAPGTCDFVRYDSQLAGAAGAFTMKMEIWTNDTVELTPLAPVVGTTKNCNGTGINGALTTCSHSVFPAIPIPTAEFWMVYDVSNHVAGPILAADFPAVGTSLDGFAIFGNPDAGQWSQAQWWYGGCPGDPNDPTPCGTFINTVQCAGTAPVGACCDPASTGGIPCVDGVSVAQCNGRWILDATCAVDPFDPPCGTAACCKPDGNCENLTADGCATAGGLWQVGQFCGQDTQSCPPVACITATNACNQANDNAPGCADAACCELVCQVDSFCCEIAYDSSCVSFAAQFCPQTPPNDACAAAVAVGDGSFNFDTTLATTDGLPLPESCDEDFGLAFGQDIWYDYTAPVTGTATIDLCAGTGYDSRISIYSGCSCPATNTNLVACNDDNCGDPIEVGGASGAEFPVTAGQCYKIRIGGFGDAAGEGQATIDSTAGIGCPTGAVTFTNPPNNVVDARQPHPVNSTTPAQGITVFTATGPAVPQGGANPACWSVCETASSGGPVAIQSVTGVGTTYTITLSRPITAGAVTTLTYTPSSGAATTGSFRSHPGNVNGDSQAAPTDILRVIDCLNNVTPAINCPYGFPYSQDIDQSGAFGPADILRVIDLLNGADAFIVWNGTSLPSNPGTCP